MREITITASQPDAERACLMTANEGARRGPEIAALFASVAETHSLPDGQRLLLRDDPDDLWIRVTKFIEEETLCCPFFSFRARELEDGVELTITGARLGDVAPPRA
jgi:hypothetical protein